MNGFFSLGDWRWSEILTLWVAAVGVGFGLGVLVGWLM